MLEKLMSKLESRPLLIFALNAPEDVFLETLSEDGAEAMLEGLVSEDRRLPMLELPLDGRGTEDGLVQARRPLLSWLRRSPWEAAEAGDGGDRQPETAPAAEAAAAAEGGEEKEVPLLLLPGEEKEAFCWADRR